MVCKECGKEITDETLGYCPECLAPLDEPVVISMSKDDIKKANKDFEKKEKELQKKAEETAKAKAKETAKLSKENNSIQMEEAYKGPFLNLIGYVKSLGSEISNLLVLIGAVLLYISPFLPWVWQTLHKVHKKGNLFDMAGKNADMAIKTPILGVMAILLLLSGFMMMFISAREYFKPIWKYRNNFIVRLIPLVLSIIAFVVILKNKNYCDYLSSMKSLKDTAISLNQSSVFSYGRGLGFIFCIAGIAIYAVATLFDYIKYKKNK